MVPGSTLRYGSSFWRETVRCRALRMFPIDAAVMPFPTEETTPPVTKTYFDIDDLLAVFQMLPKREGCLNLYFSFCVQNHHFGVVIARRLLHSQLGLGLG